MDKDPTARSSEDSDNLGGISFEDIINPEPDVVLSKLSDKKEHVDPLMITEDDGERPEKRVKREITSSVFENSIILSPSVNNNVIQNKIVTSTGSSGSALVKIAPRTAVTAMGTTTTSMTTNGKIIYLHRSGGTTVPVRVPATIGTPTSGSNGAKPAVAIQLIRAPHTVIPVKAGKSINIPNVSQLAGKKMITAGGDGAGGQVVIKGPIKKVSGGMLSGSSTLSTSVGSTIISPVEGGKSNVRQLIASKTALTSTSNGSASGSGKVLVQNTTGTRQVMVPQNVIKISPNSPRGQLQAIQIPGKPGLQYVRVLGNSSGVTQKVNAQESNASPHYTVVRHTKPGMKLVVKSAVGDKDRKTMTTVPTLRKITDHIVVKPNDAGDNKVVRTQKISQINSQIQRFSTPGDSKGVNMPGSKIFVVSKSIIQGTVTSQNQNASSGQQRQSVATQKDANDGSDSPTSSKKLYSVLRPVTEQKEIKLKARVDPVPTKPPAAPTLPASNVNNVKQQPISRSSPVLSDDAVTIRRKHCNCTKSQCLKLYCDCFANGEFCQDCNCKDCLNNLDNEDERQKAIRICLERNPNSFKPKITAATNESDLRLHNKGCNCKRSGCLKNYCECYEAKIPCSSNCKCVGCRNVEDHPDLDMDVKKGPVSHVQTYSRVKRTYDDMAKPRTQAIQPTTTSSSSVPAGTTAVVSNATAIGSTLGPTGEKQSCNFITQEVVDATIQCLVAQADECNKSSLTQYQTEKMIMEELGRCLVEIIDFSIRNTGQN